MDEKMINANYLAGDREAFFYLSTRMENNLFRFAILDANERSFIGTIGNDINTLEKNAIDSPNYISAGTRDVVAKELSEWFNYHINEEKEWGARYLRDKDGKEMHFVPHIQFVIDTDYDGFLTVMDIIRSEAFDSKVRENISPVMVSINQNISDALMSIDIPENASDEDIHNATKGMDLALVASEQDRKTLAEMLINSHIDVKEEDENDILFIAYLIRAIHQAIWNL